MVSQTLEVAVAKWADLDSIHVHRQFWVVAEVEFCKSLSFPSQRTRCTHQSGRLSRSCQVELARAKIRRPLLERVWIFVCVDTKIPITFEQTAMGSNPLPSYGLQFDTLRKLLKRSERVEECLHAQKRFDLQTRSRVLELILNR